MPLENFSGASFLSAADKIGVLGLPGGRSTAFKAFKTGHGPTRAGLLVWEQSPAVGRNLASVCAGMGLLGCDLAAIGQHGAATPAEPQPSREVWTLISLKGATCLFTSSIPSAFISSLQPTSAELRQVATRAILRPLLHRFA